MTELDDIFEGEAERLRKEAEADDADAGIQERRARKRAAEIERHKRAGVLDEDGNPIESEEGDEEEETD